MGVFQGDHRWCTVWCVYLDSRTPPPCLCALLHTQGFIMGPCTKDFCVAAACQDPRGADKRQMYVTAEALPWIPEQEASKSSASFLGYLFPSP